MKGFREMEIKWYGQACFLITTSNNTKLLTDPFDKLPYNLPDIPVDIVTVSHNHFDHNHHKAVKGQFKLYTKSGHYTEKDIVIDGIDTFHDDANGAKRGSNIVFKYTIDQLEVCHLGDLGHMLSEEQVKKLGHIDILLIPVGGIYTIDAKKAVKVIKQLNPSIIIPMHYGTKALENTNLELDRLDKFLKHAKMKIKEVDTLNITKDNIDEYAGIVVVDYEL